MRIKFIFFCIGIMVLGYLYSIGLNKYRAEPRNKLSIDLIFLQIQQSNEQWLKRFGTLWQTEYFDFWHSPYKNFCVNGVTRFLFTNEEHAIESIDSIINHATKYSIPFFWLVGAWDTFQNLNKILKEYKGTKEQSVIMIHDLNNIVINYIPEVSIMPLQKHDSGKWLTVYNSVFREDDSNFSKKYALLIAKDLEDTDACWKYFAGYFNNTLVATGTLLVCSNYGYILNIGTSEKYRRKGIATAITVALLEEAKKLNLSYVLLEAKQVAKMYEKIGFQRVAYLNEYVFCDNR